MSKERLLLTKGQRQGLIFKVLEFSPLALHSRDGMDAIRAGKIVDEIVAKVISLIEARKDAEWQERLEQEILGNEVAQVANTEQAVKQERESIYKLLCVKCRAVLDGIVKL